VTPSPLDLTLELVPRSRLDLIDVSARVRELAGRVGDRYRRALYCSHHTTAGFLDPDQAGNPGPANGQLPPRLREVCALFPAEAGYRHDCLDERRELTDEQRLVEPRNADSHLSFMAGGLSNCAVYTHRPEVPVYLLELDGVNGPLRRTRRATVVLHHAEEIVARQAVAVGVSDHAVEAVNLADPRSGLMERVEALLAREGITTGRVHLELAPDEQGAALTVNEFETLLMQHDLADVLRDPLRFVGRPARRALRRPLSVPARSLDYAKFDLVRVLNAVLDRLGGGGRLLEGVTRRLMAPPAERRLRFKRALSLVVTPQPGSGPRIVRGTYQSPILIQWRAARRGARRLVLTVTRLT